MDNETRFNHHSHCSQSNETTESIYESFRLCDDLVAIFLPLWISIQALAFLVNSLHLAFLGRKMYLRRETKRYLFEINRCISDVITNGSMTGMLILQAVLFRVNAPFRFQDTMRTLSALICFSIISGWTLSFTYVAAAAEQYVALAYPITYRVKVTYKLIATAIGVDWILALAVGFTSGIALMQRDCGQICTATIVCIQLTVLVGVVPLTLAAFILTFRALEKFRLRSKARHPSETASVTQRVHRSRICFLLYRMSTFILSFLTPMIMLIFYRPAIIHVMQLVKIEDYCIVEKKVLEFVIQDDYFHFILLSGVAGFIWCLRAIFDPIVACIADFRLTQLTERR